MYKNLHKDHKTIELSDDESIKKENFSIETVKKENQDFTKKLIELKNKVEEEINKINDIFEKTIDDLTKSFQRKHEALLKEENDIKEKLEIFLSKSKNEIKINEKINKGIKKFKNEENNIRKTLSHIMIYLQILFFSLFLNYIFKNIYSISI